MGEEEDCRFHKGVRGAVVCSICASRVCAECATKDTEKDADSGKVYHITRCPLCELDRKVAKAGTPLSSLGTIAGILLIIPLLAFALTEPVYGLLGVDAADPGLLAYATLTLVFLVLVSLPILGLRHEIRKFRERPEKLKALDEEREALLLRSQSKH